MATPKRNRVGQVYRCLVCGAEVTVIKDADGDLAPRCCNQAMSLLPQRHRAYYCRVCGAEVVAIKEGPGELTPYCCNEPMRLRKAAA